MRNLAIIPARGGSKRIPRKNIREFLGRPIIEYSIKAAVESNLFEQVMVSTDDEEICQIAQGMGALVPFLRSARNADDNASTKDVILEVLQNYQESGEYFDHVCCIYPTAPLLRPEVLIQGYKLLTSETYTTVFPVVEYGFPIWRSLRVEHGKAEMYWPEHQFARSQDLPKAWHDAGQFYWLNTKAFLERPELYGKNSGVVILEELDVQDIDTLTDWKLAELKAKIRDET